MRDMRAVRVVEVAHLGFHTLLKHFVTALRSSIAASWPLPLKTKNCRAAAVVRRAERRLVRGGRERQRAFESGSAYQQTAAPSTGAKRGAANQEKVKALQKAGIQDDPRKPASSGNTQHKLAIASLERKKERIESAGTGKGTTQMSDALKGLAAAQERPSGPSQHQQALERLNRASEQKSGEADAYSGRPKPQIVNSTLGAEFGGNQMQQVGGALGREAPADDA